MVNQGPTALDAVFGALADPTRRAILARLANGDATVGELAAPFDISLPAISKHLGVLEEAGLLTRTREGRARRCHLEPAALAQANGWLEQYRAFWDDALDRLADFLADSTKGGGNA